MLVGYGYVSEALNERQTMQTQVLRPVAKQITRPLRPDEKKLEKRITVAVTVIPFIGIGAAGMLFWKNGLSALDLAIFAGMYVFAGLGVTVGFHRLFAHRAFAAHPALRALLAIAGSMALEGPVIRWVADHRRHHAYADVPGDPHSPHLEEAEGLRGVLKGLWHAHMGWLFGKERTIFSRFVPDLLKDPVMQRIDSLFPLWALLSLAIPPALAFTFTGRPEAALTALVWGGLARIFLLHHVTWSINSICHFYGKRPFNAPDMSTNNWALSLISLGESWHNNHHAFPSSAKQGLEPWQLDPSAWFISAMERLGVVSRIKLPSEQDLARRRTPAANPEG